MIDWRLYYTQESVRVIDLTKELRLNYGENGGLFQVLSLDVMEDESEGYFNDKCQQGE